MMFMFDKANWWIWRALMASNMNFVSPVFATGNSTGDTKFIVGVTPVLNS